MSLIYLDRIYQNITPSGAGPVTLGVPVADYTSFALANLGSNSFPYCITSANQFEVGIGIYSTPSESSTVYGVINRNTVLSNSNQNTSFINFNGSAGFAFITNAAELEVLVSAQPVQNTFKLLKWINTQYNLVDPILNGPTLGMGINSSILFYNAITTDFQADPNLQFFPGITPELYLDGVFQATAKAFKIKHPTKFGKNLFHGCLEGPEYAIYQRGTISTNFIGKIFLPEYFTALCSKYTVYFSTDSYMPTKFKKYSDCVEFKLLFPVINKIEINYLIIGERNDILFKLEG